MTDPHDAHADRGRAAVAAAEEAALGGTDADETLDRDVLHGRIVDVVNGPWWQQCGPPVTVTTPRRSTRSSTARSRGPTGERSEPTPCDGAFVSAAESAEQPKRELDAAIGWNDPLQPRDPVEIRLAEGQLTLATVAHELAHALAGIADGHGEMFRAAHIDVVALLCGSRAAGELGMSYRAFDLAVAARRWPAPWRADGETFRIVV